MISQWKSPEKLLQDALTEISTDLEAKINRFNPQVIDLFRQTLKKAEYRFALLPESKRHEKAFSDGFLECIQTLEEYLTEMENKRNGP